MNIILASKSGVRKTILEKNNIQCEVQVSYVDEDEVKRSLLAEGADPLLISKNLAELKSIKVSKKNPTQLVLGADSVVSLENTLISKPKSREEALKILQKLNGKVHYLISSVCISLNGLCLTPPLPSSQSENLYQPFIQYWLLRVSVLSNWILFNLFWTSSLYEGGLGLDTSSHRVCPDTT